MDKNFRFWVPLSTIEKSGTGAIKSMKVGGIASTSKKDMDGESLDPNGFDLSYFKNKGIVNWNHNKSPDAIIGEPTTAKLTKDGLYVEAELYPDNALAKSVYQLAETLQKSSKTRRLGFSIEGKATERDPNDDTKVCKALITNIALTISPKNPDSIVNIVKGNFNELSEDELKPYDYEFIPEFESEKLDKIEKALNTSDCDSGQPLIKESVEKKAKKQIDNEDEDDEEDIEKSKTLLKSDVVNRLMKKSSVITIEKANQFVEILNNLEMAKENEKTAITEETIEKALNILGLSKSVDSDEDDKGVKNGKKSNFKKSADADEEDDDIEDEEDDSTEEDEDEAPKKSSDKKPAIGDNLKKSLDLLGSENIEMFKGVGTLLKGIYDVCIETRSELDSVREENAELRKSIEEISGEPQGVRKSTSRPMHKSFEKGFNGNEENPVAGNVLSISQNKPQVLSLLDNMAFEKGYNAEIAKSMTMFESSGSLSESIISLIKSEKNVVLVK